MDGFQDDGSDFSGEQVENIIREAIKQTLHESSYNPKKVNEWTNMIVASCLKSLQELGKPFKYVITCMIMQKNGAGICTATSQLWDPSKDGVCKVPWENGTMQCMVTVYGLSVNTDDPADDE